MRKNFKNALRKILLSLLLMAIVTTSAGIQPAYAEEVNQQVGQTSDVEQQDQNKDQTEEQPEENQEQLTNTQENLSDADKGEEDSSESKENDNGITEESESGVDPSSNIDTNVTVDSNSQMETQEQVNLLSLESSTQAQSEVPVSIFGKTLSDIVPDINLRKSLLESNGFANKDPNSFIITEDNIKNFQKIIYTNDLTKTNGSIGNFEGLQYFKAITNINIGNANLDKFPEQLLELENLGSLVLRGIDPSQSKVLKAKMEIPSAITNLKKLHTLNFNNQLLTEIPEFLSEMTQITALNFVGSNLYGEEVFQIPESFINLTNLQKLEISNNDIKYLPSNLSQYKKLTTFRFASNKLMEISEENYKFINNLNTNYSAYQVVELKRDDIHDKSQTDGYIEIDYPSIVSFLVDKAITNSQLNENRIKFYLGSSGPNNSNTSIKNLADLNHEGIFTDSTGWLTYDSKSKKFSISNQALQAADDFNLIFRTYGDTFEGSYYSYYFSTGTSVEFDTVRTADIELAPGTERVAREGVNGLQNSQGVIKGFEPVNEVIEYGPASISFDTIRNLNSNLEPGKEIVVVKGVVGRVAEDGEVLVEKVDEVIEYGPDKYIEDNQTEQGENVIDEVIDNNPENLESNDNNQSNPVQDIVDEVIVLGLEKEAKVNNKNYQVENVINSENDLTAPPVPVKSYIIQKLPSTGAKDSILTTTAPVLILLGIALLGFCKKR